MKSDSFTRMHLTHEQLIEDLYGVGSASSHLDGCEECQSRRSVLLANRQALEAARSTDSGVRGDFLAAQRRAIYEKLEARTVCHSRLGWPRWAPVALTLFVLGTGVAVYEKQHAGKPAVIQVSDAQLALEVSKMSQDWQAEPAAPLEGLFE
ncbi:MAG: hypothetical protein ACJ746_23195 [Bryobacteraceae bacterium]